LIRQPGHTPQCVPSPSRTPSLPEIFETFYTPTLLPRLDKKYRSLPPPPILDPAYGSPPLDRSPISCALVFDLASPSNTPPYDIFAPHRCSLFFFSIGLLFSGTLEAVPEDPPHLVQLPLAKKTSPEVSRRPDVPPLATC